MAGALTYFPRHQFKMNNAATRLHKFFYNINSLLSIYNNRIKNILSATFIIKFMYILTFYIFHYRVSLIFMEDKYE